MQIEKGMVAVVTGGASGIGLGMAREFGRRGVHVVVADIEQGALDDAVAALIADGVSAFGIACDVTSPESVQALAAGVFEEHGRCNIVCNNAGVVVFGPAFSDLESWKWVIDVDMWGVVHGCHAFVPRMIDSGEPGHIVNTASTAGILGFPTIASYVAAKHAVVGMSQSMYHELTATSVSISVLCPGVVTTNINTSHRNRPGTDPSSVDKETFGTQLPEAMTPDQVAAVVAEAISDDRFWILPHPHYGDQALALAQTRIDETPPALPGML
jgi:NAD(P)-dependent dehydrogenase (short-subunit alcohol dehydrogenase family)